MSDIDIGIRNRHLTNRELAEAVVSVMEHSYRILFYDWAKSLLPEECVISFFVVDLPIFWSIDFEIIVDSEKRVLSPDTVTNSKTGHFLKLWIATAKHHARHHENATQEIERLYRKMFGTQGGKGGSTGRLRSILEVIGQDAPKEYSSLLEECERFQRKIEQAGGP